MPPTLTFAERVPQHRARVERALEHWLPPAAAHPERFHTAIRYAVVGGGKRVRPLLVYATGEWLGLAPERLDGIAAALEIVHAYTLAHQDLPAIDDDAERRGHPATHVVFDEATAILVGDALQAHAYFVLASDADLRVSAGLRRQLIVDLATASGTTGLAGGQALTSDAAAPRPSSTDIERAYAGRTGALLRAAVVMPCRLAGSAGQGVLAVAERFASAFGVAFQLADDLRTRPLGRQHPRAANRAWPALPEVIGIPAARQRLQALRDEALQALAGQGPSAEGLRWMADWLLVDAPPAS